MLADGTVVGTVVAEPAAAAADAVRIAALLDPDSETLQLVAGHPFGTCPAASVAAAAVAVASTFAAVELEAFAVRIIAAAAVVAVIVAFAFVACVERAFAGAADKWLPVPGAGIALHALPDEDAFDKGADGYVRIVLLLAEDELTLTAAVAVVVAVAAAGYTLPRSCNYNSDPKCSHHF